MLEAENIVELQTRPRCTLHDLTMHMRASHGGKWFICPRCETERKVVERRNERIARTRGFWLLAFYALTITLLTLFIVAGFLNVRNGGAKHAYACGELRGLREGMNQSLPPESSACAFFRKLVEDDQ